MSIRGHDEGRSADCENRRKLEGRRGRRDSSFQICYSLVLFSLCYVLLSLSRCMLLRLSLSCCQCALSVYSLTRCSEFDIIGRDLDWSVRVLKRLRKISSFHEADDDHHFASWDSKEDLKFTWHWNMRIHERSRTIRDLINIIWDDTFD